MRPNIPFCFSNCQLFSIFRTTLTISSICRGRWAIWTCCSAGSSLRNRFHAFNNVFLASSSFAISGSLKWLEVSRDTKLQNLEIAILWSWVWLEILAPLSKLLLSFVISLSLVNHCKCELIWWLITSCLWLKLNTEFSVQLVCSRQAVNRVRWQFHGCWCNATVGFTKLSTSYYRHFKRICIKRSPISIRQQDLTKSEIRYSLGHVAYLYLGESAVESTPFLATLMLCNPPSLHATNPPFATRRKPWQPINGDQSN